MIEIHVILGQHDKCRKSYVSYEIFLKVKAEKSYSRFFGVDLLGLISSRFGISPLIFLVASTCSFGLCCFGVNLFHLIYYEYQEKIYSQKQQRLTFSMSPEYPHLEFQSEITEGFGFLTDLVFDLPGKCQNRHLYPKLQFVASIRGLICQSNLPTRPSNLIAKPQLINKMMLVVITYIS